MKHLPLILCAILATGSITLSKEFVPNAFCIVPVADLVSYPLLQNSSHTFKSYENLPCLFFSKKTEMPRLGQLLFNEKVQIIEERSSEVRVLIDQRSYISAQNILLTHGFWMDRSTIFLLEDLSMHDKNKIPQHLSYSQKIAATENTIVLIEPWTLLKETLFSKRHITYSAGTRFTHAIHHKTIKDHYPVYIFNVSKKRFEVQHIPHSSCILENPTRDDHEKRKLFIALIRYWANRPNHKSFGYVLGGSSLVEEVEPNNFALQKRGPKEELFFVRPHHKEKEQSFNTHYLTQTGIDCSNLVSRAAQIAGIPYYAGNTSTIKHVLKPLTRNDRIENGDIVVWKGHVIIISSISKNLIVEARGYEPSAYGIVQEIPLSERFKDIYTIKDLTESYFLKKKVSLLAKTGNVKETLKDGIYIYKLL